MKSIFTYMIALLTVTNSIAQSTVKGKVTDSYQNPLENVTIVVKGIQNETVTDTNGNFEIKKVKNNDVLLISYVGYKTKEIVISNVSNPLNIILFEGNELLQEVTLKAKRNNKFSRKKTAYVSKLPLKDIENSQVYSTVTQELLQSQITTNLEDALVNATGIDKRWESTGRVSEGTVFYSIRGFQARPTLVDGVAGYTFTGIDPSYIERVEILKGPSATLFGSTINSIGGLINIVTKKPYKGFGGSASYTVGSFGLHRISADINTPLAKGENTPYFRLNTSYKTADSFQDAGFKNSFYVAPSVSYSINNRLNMSLGIEYSDTKQTNPSSILFRKQYPLASNTIKEFGINPKASFTNNDIFIENPIFNTRFITDYKITDHWNSQTIFASSHQKSEGYYQYLTEGVASFFLNPNPKTPQQVGMNTFFKNVLKKDIITRFFDKRNEQARTVNVQQNFIGNFKIGKIRNRMVVGFDYVNKKITDNNKLINPANKLPIIYGFFTPDGKPVDSFFTPTVAEKDYPLKREFLETIFNQIPANDVVIKDETFAGYISDVINITPNISASLGLRIDYFNKEGNTKIEEDNYTKTTFSPKFGLVYQPVKDKVSLFGNYQTGFVNQDPQVNLFTGKYESINPQKAKQYEFGTKLNLFNNKLSTTLSYYNINVNDRYIIHTSNRNAKIKLDELVSKGIEFELNANPANGLNLRGSIAYNDSKITKAKDKTIIGLRPEEAGPKVLYNFWGDYTFNNNSFLKNIGVGVGFNGASKYNTVDNLISGKFELPSYTLLNASIYYNHNKFRIGVKANNITNVEYYKGWENITAQKPSNFLGTIIYKF